MAGTVCYLKLNRNVEVMEDSVFLKDVGSVYCADKLVTAKVKSMKLHHFEKGQGSRCVISVLKITEMIEELCPQVTVQSVGETDVVAEWVQVSIHKRQRSFGKFCWFPSLVFRHRIHHHGVPQRHRHCECVFPNSPYCNGNGTDGHFGTGGFLFDRAVLRNYRIL